MVVSESTLRAKWRSSFTNKAQVSMEFMTFIGTMLFLLAVASYAAVSAGNDVAASNEVTDARGIASSVAAEINLAAEIGPGYRRTFDLPGTIFGGLNYTVNFTEARFVYVYWRDRFYSLPFIADNVSGAVKNGKNTIRNTNGVISFD